MSADSNHWVPQFQRANEKSLPILRWPDLFWNAKTWKTWPKIPKSQVGWELVTLSPKKIRYSKKSTKKQKTRLWIHPRQEVDDFSALGHFFVVSQNQKKTSEDPKSQHHLYIFFLHTTKRHKKRSIRVETSWNFRNWQFSIHWPSLKLTAKAPENWWFLKWNRRNFLVKMGEHLPPGFGVKIKKMKPPSWCIDPPWN